MSVAAIVLSAGTSRRFGDTDKLIAPYRGMPLARHAAEALLPLDLITKIAVISNPALLECFPGFDIVELPDGSGGQSLSISAGLARARVAKPDKILIVLADMPHVTSCLLKKIIANTTTQTPAAAINGQHIMPPVCFPSTWYPQLEALDGDAGARLLLKNLPSSALIAASPEVLHDIDRVADLTDPDDDI